LWRPRIGPAPDARAADPRYDKTVTNRSTAPKLDPRGETTEERKRRC
jgi:hypothetical protein